LITEIHNFKRGLIPTDEVLN